MNYILKVSALVLLAGALFGCQSHSSQANQNAMIIAITDDNNGSKIDATTYSGTRVIHGALYEPLVEYDKGEIKPFLATKWDMSNDGQSYTFYLDERAVFNNNEPVLAKDVKFSLERSIHFDEKQSLEISRKLKSIEIDNDHQITLTFNEPATQILLELSQARPLRMMSGKAVEPAYAIDGEFKKEIGSGPWVFQEYKTGDLHASITKYSLLERITRII